MGILITIGDVTDIFAIRVLSTSFPSFPFSFKQKEKINTGNEVVTRLMKMCIISRKYLDRYFVPLFAHCASATQ